MEPKTVGRKRGQAPVDASLAMGGLPVGARILTLSGEMPVEHLMPGDRIITRDVGMAVLRNIRRRHLVTRAVKILAGSLGDTRPDCDVILPEDQHVHVRDWRARAMFNLPAALVPAAALVDGEFITALGEVEMDVITLIFDSPHVLYVDGLELAGHDMAQPLHSAA